jgi:hypothetical protein
MRGANPPDYDRLGLDGDNRTAIFTAIAQLCFFTHCFRRQRLGFDLLSAPATFEDQISR